jgi:hypothetical protein
MEICKEGKITNHAFPIASVGIFLPQTSRYGATLFKLSIVKSYGDVATLTWQRKRDMFPEFVVVPVSPSLPLPPALETSPFRCHVNVAT